MMNAATGRSMTRIEHIRQSCRDILSTKVGTRVARRHYGSLVPDLIDHPNNDTNRLLLMSASVIALSQFEPRITINQIDFSTPTLDGKSTIDMQADLKDGSAQNVSLSIPL
jgi:phage baseplate assembly protein W